MSLRARAIGLLARREHTRTQLARRLEPHAGSAEELANVLDDLVARRLLSDERFVESRARSLRARFGSARIRFDLQRAGASAPLVEAAVRESRTDEYERAQSLWRQRFGEPAPDAAGRARQGRFLLSRGFEAAVVRRVLKEAGMAVPDEENES